jgi:transposase
MCGRTQRARRTDFRDAEAIAEAVERPTMKFVPTKTAEQLDLQASDAGFGHFQPEAYS